jgi:hypothetical protein
MAQKAKPSGLHRPPGTALKGPNRIIHEPASEICDIVNGRDGPLPRRHEEEWVGTRRSASTRGAKRRPHGHPRPYRNRRAQVLRFVYGREWPCAGPAAQAPRRSRSSFIPLCRAAASCLLRVFVSPMKRLSLSTPMFETAARFDARSHRHPSSYRAAGAGPPQERGLRRRPSNEPW